MRKFPPHIQAAQNEKASIIHLNASERVEHFDHSPQVYSTLPNGNALPRQIGFGEKEMARAPDLKIEPVGVRSCCRPKNLTLDFKLSQNAMRD